MSDFYKIWYRSSPNKVSKRPGFREYRLDDGRNLLTGVNEFLPYFSYFLTSFGEIGNKYVLSSAIQ